jgi:hypothetical protein
MSNTLRTFSLCCALTIGYAASADPAAPVSGPLVDRLEVGVFCSAKPMDQRPAPGTEIGWIYTPDDVLDFHWPSQQQVPATLGLGFGVKTRMVPGAFVQAETRVYRPGRAVPDVWDTNFSDTSDQFVFWRFDRTEEMRLGIWRFEAWDDETQIYAVEFEVVPAGNLPALTGACDATS